MPFNLILNSSNVTNFDNTTFLYNFTNGYFNIEEGAEICISQIVIPNTFFNINKGLYNNSTFKFSITIDTTTTQYTVVLKDGFYKTTDINNYLVQYFIENGMYYTDSYGINQFFIYLYANPNYFSNQFIVKPIPKINSIVDAIFPSNYINTTSFTGNTPNIIFSSTGCLNTILGFTVGSYPTTISTTTNISFLSNIPPNPNPINSIVVRTNLCNNDCASPSDILDTFTLSGVEFGENISYVPSWEKWINASYGTFSNFFLYLQDQNLNRIESLSSNVMISILLRQGETKRERVQADFNQKVLKAIGTKDENTKAFEHQTMTTSGYHTERPVDKIGTPSLKFKDEIIDPLEKKSNDMI